MRRISRGRLPRLALLAGIAIFSWQSFGPSTSSAAQAGDSAATSIPIAASGRFGGTVPPQSSTWFRFAYLGGAQDATITVTFLPADSSSVGLFIYTGSTQLLRPESGTADRTGNSLSWTFNDPSARDAFIQVVNDHQDRTLSFVGRITPTGVMQGPPQGTPVASPGQVADTPDVALNSQPDGSLVGVLAPRQTVWYRFYYGASGITSTVTAMFAPSAANARLELYTGPDVGHLTQSSEVVIAADNALTRQVVLPSPQWVYFTISNNSSSAWVAHAGQIAPVFIVVTPPPPPTPLPPTPTPTPVATPQPAPVLSHDQRYFPETRFRVDDDAVWGYFQEHGRVESFGFPVSRTFSLLGCPVQIFQRQVVQICPGRLPALLNLLDPEIFPYSRVNGSVFPGVDPALKAATPRVGDADYATAILQFVRANSPDVVDLEVWGAPISRPQPDPNNADFVYQRFQRGIVHHITSQGVTRGILLADYLKAIIRDQDVPGDLREEAQGSRFLAQYCPGAAGWLCRGGELDGTDLAFAFEQG